MPTHLYGRNAEFLLSGAAYVGKGESKQWRAILKQLESTKQYVSPGELGDKEVAFVSLKRAFAEHDLQLQFLKNDPAYEPFRDDPRYLYLMRRVGLPQ